MRKYIIEMDASNIQNSGIDYPELFEEFDYFEGKKLFKVDFQNNRKILVVDIHLKPGKTLSQTYANGNFKILEELQTKGVVHTCLVSIDFSQTTYSGNALSQEAISLFEQIIFDLPFYGDKAKVTFSLITDNQKFDQFLEQLHNYGRIKLLSAQKPDKSYEDILEKLTPRQKDSIFLAKELGYYEWPRRINATELAAHLRISKSTLVEHLRKAENALINQLLIGY